MRYYAIKISAGDSTSTPADTSGAAALTTGSTGRVAGPVLSKRGLLAPRDSSSGSDDAAIGAKQDPRQEWAQAPSGQNPSNPTSTTDYYNTPQVPSSVQPVSDANVSGAQFTSVVNGQNDPGALDVEFEIEIDLNQNSTNNHIKIKGVTPSMISQASNFNQQRLQLWAGYSDGLPLANIQTPHQGLIMDGMIWPAFGNWVYNELSLEFFVTLNVASVGGPTAPKNIVHNMPAGQPLSTAIQNTLKTAFPKSTISVNISDSLKLNYPDWGIYQSLEQFGNYVKALSHSILGTPPKYNGVTITTNGTNISVSDGTKVPNAIQIRYEDLVGQPTWIENNTIQVKVCMRGDINFPGTTYITLPTTLITQTAMGAVSAMADPSLYTGKGTNLLFAGTWAVTGLRHIGKFRDPSMDAWVTIIKAVKDPASTNPNTPDSSTPSSQPGGSPNQSGQQNYQPLAPGGSYNP